MCSYYCRFLPNFKQIAEPIIMLTRKYAHFKWSDVHQKAFEFLKESLTITQKCDGDENPIYYLSHKLSRSQCKWSVVEKEAFGIHFALQKLD